MLLEADGILAMLIILGAYAGISSGYLTPRSPLYQTLNLVGSLMFVVYLSTKNAWPSVVLNAVWATIALVVLIRRLRRPALDNPGQSA